VNKIQCIKIRGYSRISVAQIGLKTGKNVAWRANFLLWDRTGTNHGLIEVGSIAQVLRILFSSSEAQSRTQCFEQSSKQTLNGRETGS